MERFSYLSHIEVIQSDSVITSRVQWSPFIQTIPGSANVAVRVAETEHFYKPVAGLSNQKESHQKQNCVVNIFPDENLKLEATFSEDGEQWQSSFYLSPSLPGKESFNTTQQVFVKHFRLFISTFRISSFSALNPLISVVFILKNGHKGETTHTQ